MISLFLTFSYSFNKTDCSLLYSESCDICITHYLDRQCGFCSSTNSCMNIDDKSQCTGTFYYGPQATCTQSYDFTPTPTPIPQPTQLPDQCNLYTDCETCSSHLSDRNCGWCQSESGEGLCVDGSNYKCNGSLYYNGNAKCGQPTPTPTPTPWPHYESNPTYCRLLSDTWCTKCVSSQPNMSCVWCFDTNECAMGNEQGFLYGTCTNYASTNNDKCQGKISTGGIIAVRIVLAIFVVAMIVIGVFICYKVIKEPETNRQTLFEQIQ